MLITVYHGVDVGTAKDKGAMHFDALPSCGEEVEIDRKAYVVGRVWHLPSARFAGAKLAILINEAVDEAIMSRTPALASA
ncbi:MULTISPECIES: hypothetical protein [Sphingobium]|jgi:hypothetical protein|uniref:Uncharacterized protein n=1 Tax=Sphingobium psychrophilum TaxID=2728834 RepID=A0A7X9ZTB1_9SPHN|nr:hypothetical protein [Sphingobium psychrophilum]NML11965.1 hypothetical protein [Sphingobium psychrophilum]